MDHKPGGLTSNPQQGKAKKLYREIVEDKLQIPFEFFKRSSGTIRDKLLTASKALSGLGPGPPSGQYFGEKDIAHNIINVCVHVASSVVLLESSTQDLKQAMTFVETRLRDVDASTVLTACTLYYIIHDAPPATDFPEGLQSVHKYLDHMQWLIGTTAMQKLGIEPLKEVRAQP
jgi:hypothetical protein